MKSDSNQNNSILSKTSEIKDSQNQNYKLNINQYSGIKRTHEERFKEENNETVNTKNEDYHKSK